MKKSILFFFLIGMFVQLSASNEQNLLTKAANLDQLKQMLAMNQEWVSYPAYSNRSAWIKLLGENGEIMIRDGEGYLSYEWQVVRATDYLDYKRTGNRNTMQEPYFENQRAFSALVLAELAEGEGRFLDQIIDGVFVNCEMTSWVLSAHFKISAKKEKNHFPDVKENLIGLYSSQTGAMLSWTYYFLHDEFDKVNPLISERLRSELQKRILDPYMNMNYWWTALPPFQDERLNVNNWNPWCNANVLQCYMLLENDRDKLAQAVYRSMRSVDQFINANKDGACDEGPKYWGVAAGKMYDYLSLLEKLTDGQISLFNKPEIKSMAEYVYRANVGNDWVVNFADASAKLQGNPYLIYSFGRAVESDDMMHFAAYLKERNPENSIVNSRDIDRTLRSALISGELEATEPKFNVPAYSWYPETEYCFMSDDQGSFVAAKGGDNNENHNHNDVGSFIYYSNSLPIIMDTGVGSYTAKTFGPQRYSIWTMQSNYHNVPLINGVSQHAGADFKAMNTAFDKENMRFTTNIVNAYPKEAKVKSWKRSYNLKNGTLIIDDLYVLEKTIEPNQINFMTWGDVNLDVPGKVIIKVKNETVELRYDKKKLKATIETIELEEKKLSQVWGDAIYRLSLNAKMLETEGNYQYSIRKVK
ncbi:heparinase II/III family protein [Algibacter miyuki]|uniref:Heparinase II/III family protein n=1 Tax=Algibacter miyuki TaxID=1306933 RepID=A0ABV5H4X8_9FLAO|nr:heparinase II/III family protein [Algibacter miyuki]MDN3663989.1 heparinase II/III family protein [Algibacter miyuki]